MLTLFAEKKTRKNCQKISENEKNNIKKSNRQPNGQTDLQRARKEKSARERKFIYELIFVK